MAGKWKEVVRLRFKGPRFRDHALDLAALSELSQFQKVVTETAKVLWREANPDRKNLPEHFENCTRLCLRTIEEGSTTAPLEVYMEDERLWEEEPSEINDAIELAHKVFTAVERGSPLPDGFPRSLLPEYMKLGEQLKEDDEIEFMPPGKAPARVTLEHRRRLETLKEPDHETTVDLTGEVREADVHQKRCQLWVNEKKVVVSFSDAQEDQVTTALKQHKSARMRVKGCAEMSREGDIRRVKEIELLQIHPTGEPPFDHSARPIGEILEELAAEVPQEEWDQLPDDLSENLDHYLYGTPKK